VPNPPFDGELPESSPPLVIEDLSPSVATAASDEAVTGLQRVRPGSKRQIRKSKARSRSKGVRWTRRGLMALGVVIVLIIALVIGGYFYFVYPLHSLTRVDVKNLRSSKPGAPFTVLVTGSDSRAFVKTKGQCKSFGCGSETGGQRSDVIILARVVPATHEIEMLSIPRDTWVTIPGNVQYISGQNRINAAFNTGPALLVQTIEQDFHIPINYFVAVNFPGLQSMVDSIGGIHLMFRDPVKDVVSGLHIKFAGCQVVHGVQALALVRSRHLQYKVKGVWYSDYGSDFTRIRNQQAFFRAVIHQLNSQITNPIAIHDFINAAVHNLTIDQSLTTGTMFSLAREFHSFPAGSLRAVTLPTIGPYITSGGADVLLPAAAPDETVIQSFLSFGTPGKTATHTTTTTSGASTTSSAKGTASGTAANAASWVSSGTGATSAVTTSANSTTTTQPNTTVTTIVPPPPGETPIYNNGVAPYDPTPC
jgi:LCP family protein required for cell wall assembly